MPSSILQFLQVGVFLRDVGNAGAGLVGVEVVVAYYQGAGVAPFQLCQQPAEGGLLRVGARVGGLAADVQAALVADAYRVGVVVQAVGAGHVFGSAGLYLSVATDDVVVAYAELPASLAVPRVYLGCRTGLPRPHCRPMNDDQCYFPHSFLSCLNVRPCSSARGWLN